MRGHRQSLADWIQPDVPGYGFGFLGFAEDVIVEIELPEFLTTRFLKSKPVCCLKAVMN